MDGRSAQNRSKRVRKQKTDRQDSQLILQLLMEDRFPQNWVPDAANRDLRQLLRHRHRLVTAQMRTALSPVYRTIKSLDLRKMGALKVLSAGTLFHFPNRFVFEIDNLFRRTMISTYFDLVSSPLSDQAECDRDDPEDSASRLGISRPSQVCQWSRHPWPALQWSDAAMCTSVCWSS